MYDLETIMNWSIMISLFWIKYSTLLRLKRILVNKMVDIMQNRDNDVQGACMDYVVISNSHSPASGTADQATTGSLMLRVNCLHIFRLLCPAGRGV